MVGEEKISEMPKYKWKWSMSLVTANVESRVFKGKQMVA